MCNIAGYNGKMQAAPLLLEMLRNQEGFDGSACTGITTIHDGRLYTRRVVGNVDTLIKTTDALYLPGTIGIAHTRPGGTQSQYNFTHPFVTRSGRMAGLTNGTTRYPKYGETVQVVTSRLEELGYTFGGGTYQERSSFPTLKNGNYVSCVEVRVNLVEEYVKSGMDIPSAMARVCSECYTDSVLEILSLDTPDVFYVNRTTRPTYQLICDHGTMVASCKFAFPDELADKAERLPILRPVTVTREGAILCEAEMKNCEAVAELTESAINEGYERISALLRAKAEAPLIFDDIELAVWNNMRDLFEGDHTLIQDAMLVYEVLFRLHREGNLKRTTKMMSDVKRRYFMWVE